MSTRRGTLGTDLAAVEVRVGALEEATGGAPAVPRALSLVDTVLDTDGANGVLLANSSTTLSTLLTLPAAGGIVTGTRQLVLGGVMGVIIAAGSGATVIGDGMVPPGGAAWAVRVASSTWWVGGTGATHWTSTADTPYVQFRSRPTTGEDALIQIPVAAFAATDVPVIVVTHGVGADADMINQGNWTTLREPMLDEGWVVCCSDAHGQAWGNDASQADIAAMRSRVTDLLGSGPTVLVGSSMGGMPSLLMIADGDLPNVVGWAGLAPVCSLADMYDGGAGTYQASIESAYGIAADGSDYSSKTANHDPLLRDAEDFAGVPMRFYASPSDSVVDKTANSDAFAAYVLAEVPEATVVPVTGAHLSAEHYLPDDLIPWIEGCLSA